MGLTEQELQDLRDFLAREVMGWDSIDSKKYWYFDKSEAPMVRITDYRPDSPDSPASQLLGVIEGMDKKGMWLRGLMYSPYTKKWTAMFTDTDNELGTAVTDTLPLAVCLAARAALEGKK